MCSNSFFSISEYSNRFRRQKLRLVSFEIWKNYYIAYLIQIIHLHRVYVVYYHIHIIPSRVLEEKDQGILYFKKFISLERFVEHNT